MPARAWATMRSAAATCSSSAWISGASAFSRTSQLATATSLSCNANNASRSGCTLPPCGLNDSIGRSLGVTLSGEADFFMREGRFLSIARKRQRAIDALDFPIQAPGFKLVHGALEERIRLLVAEPFRLQRFVRARGGLV